MPGLPSPHAAKAAASVFEGPLLAAGLNWPQASARSLDGSLARASWSCQSRWATEFLGWMATRQEVTSACGHEMATS